MRLRAPAIAVGSLVLIAFGCGVDVGGTAPGDGAGDSGPTDATFPRPDAPIALPDSAAGDVANPHDAGDVTVDPIDGGDAGDADDARAGDAADARDASDAADARDGADAADASPSPTTTVPCGATTCAHATQYCCLDAPSCQPKTGGTCTGKRVECNDKSDCPGSDRCCYDSASATASCQSGACSGGDIPVCDIASGSTACPSGTTCIASTISLPGYGICL